MRNIRLTLEFEGTNYAGWQKQINGISVQQKINEAVFKLTNEKTEIIGCSRTDAGVHAKKYVCNFNTECSIPSEKFKYALNNILPLDIVVLESTEAAPDFHSRFHAKSKRYVYSICNREIPAAIGRNYVCHFKKKLDVDKMTTGAAYLIGQHDFSAFKNANSIVYSNVRTIYDIKITSLGDMIYISVSGDGFLYNMVRIIAGTLIEAGICKIEPEEVSKILESRNRKNAGRTAPASGLCLEEVFY
ncbi:MAG: tRNA pseudouridine(38-40) synthase TruA [Solirubrobacterales bacterium]